jgi:glucokinase
MAMATTAKVWVGFDLGGTKMQAKVFDDSFKELGAKRRKTKGTEGMRAGLGRMVGTIEELLAELAIPRERVAGIGVGCPGPLDLDAGVILYAPNLGWKNAPVRKTLEKAFGCPAAIVNDVDSGTYGEYLLGAGQGARCLLGVFPGTGIGGGCVYEGKILRGRTCSVLEIGHMQVQPEGPLCGCGRTGCLEAVASRLAIASAAVAAAHRGEAPHLLAAAGTDLAAVRSNVLAESIRGGDVAVERIVRQAARWVGVAVGNAVNLLGPDTVVLGGGLVEAMPDLFLAETTASAMARAMPAFEGTFKVVAAKLGDDATVKGAAGWAKEMVRGRR